MNTEEYDYNHYDYDEAVLHEDEKIADENANRLKHKINNVDKKLRHYSEKIIFKNRLSQDLSKTKIEMSSNNLNYNETVEELSVYAVTWNLFGKCADAKDLAILIPKNKFHHIYAIGTEECMRSIITSLFYDNKCDWEKVLQ